jgi:apolipoprotein N-acyltransferase
MVLAWLYSSAVLTGETLQQPRTSLSVGVVQPNIDQAVKWDIAYRDETMQRFDRLTAQLGTSTDLIVWPEAATPFILEREKEYQLQLIAWADRAKAPILLGSPALRYYPDRRPYLLNSAYLLASDGNLLGRYDKHHLVPFGEYIPFKSSLLFFLDKLVEGIGDFNAGPGSTVLSFTPKSLGSGNPASSRPVKFGVAICYEVIFPDLVRRFAANGAEFLVTITNDGWFGASSAPAQHFSMVVFRSVENHLNFRVRRSLRPHHASHAPLHGAGVARHHSDQAVPHFLQLQRRCVCLRLCYNLRAFVPVRLFPHEGTGPRHNRYHARVT